MSVVVTLTESEIMLAGTVMVQRHAQNVTKEREEKYGAEDNLIEPNMTGALGEIALAKHLNIYWSGALGKMRAKDVGVYQVRASLRRNPSLVLHDEDKDEDVFICASVDRNRVTLLGWLRARDGKQKRFWRTDVRGPAYFVTEYHDFKDKRNV